MTAQTVAQRQQAYKAAQKAAGLVRLEAYVTAEQRDKFRALGGDEWLRKRIDAARTTLRAHLESHDALLRQALDALESCDGDDGLKGYRQFYDEKLVEPAIASLKQALETK